MGKSTHSSNQAGFHVTVIKASQIRRTWEQQGDLSCWPAHGTSSLGGMGEVQSFFFPFTPWTPQYQQNCKLSTLLTSTESKYSNLESSLLFPALHVCFTHVQYMFPPSAPSLSSGWSPWKENKWFLFFCIIHSVLNSAAYLKRAHPGPLRLCSLQFKKYILFL